ncbi:hypothetical protein BABINDRAFT_174759 [Babjeviella inositovora NRRL Y-12698]|uniref:Uncharacterized protein n=1 Tax=Babjeviella inositovora NRRL Y-12698 TaxID=984486 RepID=A0A1E3QT97_9ASCO|nr:uncharacterized protein BABINDRAFT_174759 [Babjeviella inositovora NRRL Y-12698]ODQ80925.1 hypothetical protein BABINDRAFT_174759 [Babjeviella inositovora NRRL Y-12698]
MTESSHTNRIPHYLLSLPYGRKLVRDLKTAAQSSTAPLASETTTPSGYSAAARLNIKLSSMGLLGTSPQKYILANPDYLEMLSPILQEQASGVTPFLGLGASAVPRMDGSEAAKADTLPPPLQRRVSNRGYRYNPNHDHIFNEIEEDDDDNDLDAEDLDGDDDSYDDGTVSISVTHPSEPGFYNRAIHLRSLANSLVESELTDTVYEQITDLEEIRLLLSKKAVRGGSFEDVAHLPTTWVKPDHGEKGAPGVTISPTRNLVDVTICHPQSLGSTDSVAGDYTFIHTNTSISQYIGVFYFETEIMFDLVNPFASGRNSRAYYGGDHFHQHYANNNDLILGFIQTHVLNDTTAAPSLSALTHSPLMNPHSLVLSVNDAMYYNRAGKKVSLPRGCVFKKGDVVGLGLNFITNTVLITCNGFNFAEIPEEYRDLTPRHICSVKCQNGGVCDDDTVHYMGQETNEWMPMLLCSQSVENVHLRTNFGSKVGTDHAEKDFLFDIVGYVKHSQETIYNSILKAVPAEPLTKTAKEKRKFGKELARARTAAKVEKKTIDATAMNQMVMSFLVNRGYLSTTRALLQDLSADDASRLMEMADDSTTHLSNRKIVMDYILADKPSMALRFCELNYPALVDSDEPSDLSPDLKELASLVFFQVECLILYEMIKQQAACDTEDDKALAEAIRYGQKLYQKYKALHTKISMEPLTILTSLLAESSETLKEVFGCSKDRLKMDQSKHVTAKALNVLILYSLKIRGKCDLEAMVDDIKANLRQMRQISAMNERRVGKLFVESNAICLQDFLE